MTPNAIANDLGTRSDLDALVEVMPVAGLTLADVGCGDGWLARELARLGASVTGVEPETEQARRNAAATPTPGTRFLEGRAETLPFEDDALDGVVFNYSLHHVPTAALASALAEARRVLRASGFLYVADPVPEGSFCEVMAPFHDETQVQRAAERALAEHARPAFAEESVYRYVTHSRYADFDSFVEEMLAPAHVRYAREQVSQSEVRRRFERCEGAGGFVLEQPVRINLFRLKRTA